MYVELLSALANALNTKGLIRKQKCFELMPETVTGQQWFMQTAWEGVPGCRTSYREGCTWTCCSMEWRLGDVWWIIVDCERRCLQPACRSWTGSMELSGRVTDLTLTQSTASNLSYYPSVCSCQLSLLLQWDRKQVVVYLVWRPVWLTGVVGICVLAVPWVQLPLSTVNRWPHNVPCSCNQLPLLTL